MGMIYPSPEFLQWVNEGLLMKTKIKWHRLPGYKLKATWEVPSRGMIVGLKEADMDPIHDWSKTNKCGIRMSFDMWQFKTPEEMTMFLLKWA